MGEVELQKPVEPAEGKAPKVEAEGSENGEHADERKGDDWSGWSHGISSAGEPSTREVRAG